MKGTVIWTCMLFQFSCICAKRTSGEKNRVSDLKHHKNYHLLDFEECGENMEDRIIGGENAGLGQFPWIVRIEYRFGELCGGAIINNRYVLTAAHCPLLYYIEWITAGEHTLSTDPDCQWGVCAPPVQRVRAEEVIVYEDYNRGEALSPNDISLIRLRTPLIFHDFVRPICLPVFPVYLEGRSVEVAGWGISYLHGGYAKLADVLQRLRFRVLPRQHCEEKYYDLLREKYGNITFDKNKYTPNTHFCGGGVKGKDTCGGDSGGPVMTPISHDGPPKYFLIGVVSFGRRNCAQTTYPAFYSKVSIFSQWILDHMRE